MSTWNSFSKRLQQVGSILETLDQTAAKGVEKYRSPHDLVGNSTEGSQAPTEGDSEQALLHTLNGLIDKPIKGAKPLGQSGSSTKLASMATGPHAKGSVQSGNLEANIDDIFASMATSSGPTKMPQGKAATLQATTNGASPPNRTKAVQKSTAGAKVDQAKKEGTVSAATTRRASITPTATSISSQEKGSVDESGQNGSNAKPDDPVLVPSKSIDPNPVISPSEESVVVASNVDVAEAHPNEDTETSTVKSKMEVDVQSFPIDIEPKQEHMSLLSRSTDDEITTTAEPIQTSTASQDVLHRGTSEDINIEADKSEIASLQALNNSLSHQLNAVNKELESKSIKFKQTQIRITELTEEVSSLKSALYDKEAQLSQKSSSDKDFQKQLSTRDSQIATLQLKMKQAVEALKLRDETLEALEAERESMKKDHISALATLQQTITSMKASYKQIETELENERREHQQSRSRTSERELKLENEALNLNRTLVQYQRSLDEKNLEVIKLEALVREGDVEAKKWKQDLADYKVKANKALQAKEKEIERLLSQQHPDTSSSPKTSSDSTLSLLNQLEELNGKLHDSLTTNSELAISLRDAEATVAELSDWKARATEIEKDLEQERSRSEDLNAQLEQVTEELRKSREETTRLKISATNSSVTHGQEIQKLQKQLDSLKSSDRSEAIRELESRLRTTTDHLISRQAQLEKVQSEKAALQLKLESEYRVSSPFFRMKPSTA
eukprot:TRINITY_DN4884_c0_g1_i13.p1 TRINITY_DN4884_c0_g1~~TRINITY_DN4884_c0_g1_i13.p1  ORF type:complete len:730 (+),score=165.83 TRINITY_DN4884_c0_g1_i13:228-2417(+)